MIGLKSVYVMRYFFLRFGIYVVILVFIIYIYNSIVERLWILKCFVWDKLDNEINLGNICER